MAAIDDLVAQVKDAQLRARLEAEVQKLREKRHFGLVFEEHLPECTPLYDVPIRPGCQAGSRVGEIKVIYRVLDVQDGQALCVPQLDDGGHGEVVTLPVDELVTVAKFGEPIYPYLEKLDQVENAPGDPLWHIVMEAENFHALQLLAYLYPHKCDCLYLDPPYNTGAKDWKYNNNYVDGNDQYRHSKWLSFMKHRLELAKKLLNPRDSVLIVTIDEKEYLHLGCLLEEMFPDANIQMITSVISGKGVSLVGQFSRVEEYIFILTFGQMVLTQQKHNMLNDIAETDEKNDIEVEFIGLRRRNTTNFRTSRPNQFYPFFVDENDGHIVEIGDVVPAGIDRKTIPVPKGCIAIWPLDPNGRERIWGLVPESSRNLLKLGCIKIGKWNKAKKTGTVKYWASGNVDKLKNGEIEVLKRDKYGAIEKAIYKNKEALTVRPRKVWNMKTHNASTFGTLLLGNILTDKRFSFPKSLYAVRDTLKFFVSNKPNAIVLDFFAGSGTTLHAVNLLNAEDGGHRRCILVTNNEVSNDEAKAFSKQGLKPGDVEWESHGIAKYVTWPRTVCSIEGHDINGQPLKGTYLDSDRKMSDGFAANACFYKLGYLDKNAVSLGQQFCEMIPMLWMKAGAIGPCPEVADNDARGVFVFPANHFAILKDPDNFADLLAALPGQEIRTVYIITDSTPQYQAMVEQLPRYGVIDTYQLYRDYLDNFRMNEVMR